MTALDSLHQLVEKFDRDKERFTDPDYNEAQLREEFVNPFFRALGWDLGEQVLHEAALRSGGTVKHPDYTFLAGSRRAFYVETKKPSINIGNSVEPAEQLRSYGWSGDTALGILTNFAEFSVYDCRVEPVQGDLPEEARVMYLTSSQYLDEWDRLRATLSPEAVRQGKHGDILETTAKGVLRVDEAFLRDMETWRVDLAPDIYKQARFIHRTLSQRELNHLVQRTIDRIVFLRIAEDRNLESYGRLERAASVRRNSYNEIKTLYIAADRKYNSGLFHFDPKDKSRPDADTLSLDIRIGDGILRKIIADLYPPKSRYQFSVISADILGQVYERFLGKVIEVRVVDEKTKVTVEEKPEVRKAGGVYYTPAYIVDYIVENTVGALLKDKTPAQVANLRVLDPACGSGSFLVGAYQYLLDWHLAYYRRHPKQFRNRRRETPAGMILTTVEKRRILLNNIYGVDLDQNAVEVSKLSLLLKMLENENEATGMSDMTEPMLPDLSGNIKWGNSLIGSDFFSGQEMAAHDNEEVYRVKPFDWAGKAGFGEIMAAGGFDAVIGNPPYVRIQTMKETAPETVPYYKQNYVSASKGNYDIYVVFVEKGLQLLNEKGLLGFILPHKFFNAKYGEALRGLIANGNHLRKVVHFGHQQVFEGATTYTCLMFLSKRRMSETEYIEVDDIPGWMNKSLPKSGTVSSVSLSAERWHFIIGDSAPIYYRLRNMPFTLRDVTERIFQGLKTSADKVFIVHEIQRKNDLVRIHSPHKQQEYWLEIDLLHPLIKGGDSNAYRIDKTDRLILFPYSFLDDKKVMGLIPASMFQEKYPLTWKYLIENKEILENRERGRMIGDKWYGYVYPKALDVISQPKIFTPDISPQASYAPDETGEFFFTGGVAGGYGITVKPEFSRNYILGLLNSKLLDWYLHQISTTLRGGWYSYESKYISHLPIRTIDFNNPADVQMHDEMVKLVDEMLDLHKQLAGLSLVKRGVIESLIERTDRKIDALVYRLYGLSEDEVGVVES